MPDFDKLYPWNRRRRVAMNSSGLIVGIHDENDTDKWNDGTSVDWDAYESAGWNCMVEVPKFYYKQQKTTVWEFAISPVPRAGYDVHPAFIDSNGQVKNYYYLSAFEGYVDGDNVLRSLPYYQPTTDVTMTNFINYAQANGTGWGLWDWNMLWAEQLQFFIEYGTLYSQSVFEGITNLDSGTGNHSQNTGHTCSLGNASGEVELTSLENSATFDTGSATYPFSFRGAENLYGNIWKWVDGFTRNPVDDENPSGAGVGKVDIVSGGTTTRYDLEDAGTSHIYPTNFESDIPGMIGKTGGGSDSTYLTDYMLRSDNSDRKCSFGGFWFDGGAAGVLCLFLSYPASYSSSTIGTRAAFLN